MTSYRPLLDFIIPEPDYEQDQIHGRDSEPSRAQRPDRTKGPGLASVGATTGPRNLPSAALPGESTRARTVCIGPGRKIYAMADGMADGIGSEEGQKQTV